MFNIGGLTKGKSILIHSAAGGIGLSCIQLAQFAGAEIYVTAGSEKKRKLLHETFGIPEERIFSSRDNNFAAGIMKVTQGRGIDVIMNSLVSELLDESWRICADGGCMVEIGKKDIVDRNFLSMESFNRNCSFRTVDFSYTPDIKDALIQQLLGEIFQLVANGQIGPVHPITTYSFDQVPAAFAFMRSGQHVGKIVIARNEQPCEVLVRPAARKMVLRPDRSYVIVGGLKGLCGSLATFMARNGATNIVAFSRRGIQDKRSQKVVANCAAAGCTVTEGRGDVFVAEDVDRALAAALYPIGGIIQGAMVLRDRPFEVMTHDDYHTTLSNKVAGTWNLHNTCQRTGQPLDCFTLPSSISGIVGQKGQANYSAANVFLDAFAVYRRSLGLVANSVNLGVIEDVGYVAEQGGMKSHFDDKQWAGINESMLHRILSFSIVQQSNDPYNQESGAQLITGIPFPQPADSELKLDARFSHLFVPASDASRSGKASGSPLERATQTFFLQLENPAADPEALLAAAVDVVGMKFVQTLRLSAAIEPGKSLSTYGLDSLSAFEFRNWVRVDLGADITVLEITAAASLYALCSRIIAKLKNNYRNLINDR